ncbi:MAG: hypothetical protein ABSF80_00920 [Chitinispirillaceae bacterium]|jgi:hypothetical protein
MKKINPETMIMAVSTGVLLFLFGTVAPTYAQQERHEPDAQQPQRQEQQAGGQHDPGQQEQQAKPEQEQQARPEQEQQAKDQQKQQQAKVQQVQQQAKVQQEQKQAKVQQVQKQAKVQQEQQQAKVPQEQKQANVQQEQKQANRPSKQVQSVQQSEQGGVWKQHRAHSWQSEHRSWQQRGGYNGYWIPEDRFRGHFGRDHGFRIYSLSFEIFRGYPCFEYGGLWFGVVDPWPEYWSDDWYQNDDVYIDYSGDGYYLYNHRYPRDRIAITAYVN